MLDNFPNLVSNFFFCSPPSEKYHAQMKEAQQVVAEKTMALEQEAFKYRRVQVRVRLHIVVGYCYVF